MSWIIGDFARLKLERDKLSELSHREKWCTVGEMKVDAALTLSFDIDLTIHGEPRPVTLRYPAHFPATPPSVYPREKDAFWTLHQYGPGGELCTEYGPDTWTTDLAGADLIESVYRLLNGESSTPDKPSVVPSRHSTSVGQRLRSALYRLVSSQKLESTLATLSTGQVYTGTLSGGLRLTTALYMISSITIDPSNTWKDPTLPESLLFELSDFTLAIVRIGPDDPLPDTAADAFRVKCRELGVEGDPNYVALLKGTAIHLYVIYSGAKAATKFSVVPPQPSQRRLSESHDALSGKTVGIVGCGSIGSKIGVSLARSGVGNFFLLDDDILFPHNLVRNDLDWREVGSHKSEALGRRMKLVNRNVTVRSREIQLAGQESNSSAASALKSLSECDLIIDATATPQAFNLISAVAEAAEKSVLWAEVFAGGFGGLIARSRPGLDPSPQFARRSIENWFKDSGAPPNPPATGYGLETEKGPMIADDGDVSAIAAHATRLAIDTLIGRDPSYFPYSAYAIGLAKDDFFTQPFDTRPIDLGPVVERPRQEKLSAEETEKQVADILAALGKT